MHTKYGKLQKINARWDEYKTAPIIVANKKSLHDNMLPYVGKVVNYSADNNVPIRMETVDRIRVDGLYKPTYGYNMHTSVANIFNQIPYLFLSEQKDLTTYRVSADELANYIYSYDKSYVKGKLPIIRNGKNISADLFLDTVDKGRTRGENVRNFDANEKFDLLSYDDTHSGWQKFWAYFGGKIETGESHIGVSPFEEIKITDLMGADADISKKYLVNEADISSIREEILKDPTKKTYLFRFAQTDYYCTPINIFDSTWGTASGNDILAQETVFFDFTIIDLTFNKDGVYKVIPAVSNPLDIISAIPPPLIPEDGLNWLWIILGLIVLLLIGPIIAPLIGALIKLIVWLIPLPFKAIGALFKRGGNGGNKTRGEPSGGGKYTNNGDTVNNTTAAKEKARKRFEIKKE